MRRMIPLLLLLAALLTGCTASPAAKAHPDWDETWFAVGDLLAVEPMQPFLLGESNDVLSPSGLYYATWVYGEGREIVNSTGRDATVYDAQIYLLVKECKSGERAEQETLDWTEREAASYETGALSEQTVGDQCYRVLPLLESREGNPYSHGAAAFAVRGELAISIELLCSDTYDGDAQEILTGFLTGFHYGE